MLLKKVRTLCESRGITINKLEKELGYSQGSIGKMSNSVPKADRLYDIAKYFDVPMEYFFAEEDAENARGLESFIEWVKEQEKNEKPLYRASAGQGAYNGDYVCKTVEDYDDGFEYATVIGDSMLPILKDGDVVKIQPTTQTSPHDLTVVKINGDEATIKYFEVVENGVWLRAENKDVFEDRFYSIQEVMTLPITIIGKVVELRRTFK